MSLEEDIWIVSRGKRKKQTKLRNNEVGQANLILGDLGS
jgi:hypothetical protein